MLSQKGQCSNLVTFKCQKESLYPKLKKNFEKGLWAILFLLTRQDGYAVWFPNSGAYCCLPGTFRVCNLPMEGWCLKGVNPVMHC